jgi:hypothetical protein
MIRKSNNKASAVSRGLYLYHHGASLSERNKRNIQRGIHMKALMSLVTCLVLGMSVRAILLSMLNLQEENPTTSSKLKSDNMDIHHIFLQSQSKSNTMRFFKDVESNEVEEDLAMQDKLLSSDLKLLSIPRSLTPVIYGQDGAYYQQVLYRANTASCGRDIHVHNSHAISQETPRLFPMYKNGNSAGPVIDCTSSMVLNGTCNPVEKLFELEAVKSLVGGEAYKFFLPHQPFDTHNSVIIGRPRMSSSTGVVFIDDKHLIAASFGMQKIYLYEYSLTNTHKYARLLDSVDTTDTPELIDFDKTRNLISASLLRSGKQASL